MARNPEVLSARGRVASLTRSRNHDDTDLVNARRDLKAAVATDLVEELVEQAPPLTAEQTERIVAILRSGQQ